MDVMDDLRMFCDKPNVIDNDDDDDHDDNDDEDDYEDYDEFGKLKSINVATKAQVTLVQTTTDQPSD